MKLGITGPITLEQVVALAAAALATALFIPSEKNIRAHLHADERRKNPAAARWRRRSKKRFKSARAAWMGIERATGAPSSTVVEKAHTASHWRFKVAV